jgi:hypothetical protein
MADTRQKGRPRDDDGDRGEEYPNQSSLCASCIFGVRQVITDTDEVPLKKQLIFFCHSKAIRADNPQPAGVYVLIHECDSYRSSVVIAAR